MYRPMAELIDSCKISANGVAERSLAEKPKMGELQMDWLRSEDLKEEKNVTAPNCHDSTYGAVALRVSDVRGVTLEICEE